MERSKKTIRNSTKLTTRVFTLLHGTHTDILTLEPCYIQVVHRVVYSLSPLSQYDEKSKIRTVQVMTFEANNSLYYQRRDDIRGDSHSIGQIQPEMICWQR